MQIPKISVCFKSTLNFFAESLKEPLLRRTGFGYNFIKRLNADVFEHQKVSALNMAGGINEEVYAKSARKILRMPYQILSKEFLDNMPVPKYAECIDVVRSGKNIENISKDSFYIARYGDILEKGLKKTYGDNFKFVSIGQSPAIFAQYLELKGYDTAICPASSLTMTCPLAKIFPTEAKKIDYFKYLKVFGLDLEKVDAKKTIVFSDYTISGESLDGFKRIIEKKIPSNVPCDFKSLADIAHAGCESFSDVKMRKTVDILLLDTYLKKNYSPVFKLPMSNLSDIKAYHKNSLGSIENDKFNKLKFVLYENLYSKYKH